MGPPDSGSNAIRRWNRPCPTDARNAMLTASRLPFDEKFEIQINSFLPVEGNHFFNEPDYFKLHSRSDNDCHLQLVRRVDNRVYATLAFHEVADRVYASPGRGTFGGPSLTGELELLAVERFLTTAVQHLRHRGAEVIRIRCAPASHDGALFAINFNALARQGFQPLAPEINYDLRVDGRSFIERVAYGNVKRIRKAVREGFVCECVDHALLPEVHQLIASNRARLGVEVSMSLDQLRELAEHFPKRLQLFATYRDGGRQAMVAAAVCLGLAPGVLYVLYWGDVEDMRSYSPVALLAAVIYKFCVEQGFSLLDAGISTLQGEPNHGLVNFKRNLGFTESLKLEMVWSVEPGKEGN